MDTAPSCVSALLNLSFRTLRSREVDTVATTPGTYRELGPAGRGGGSAELPGGGRKADPGFKPCSDAV